MSKLTPPKKALGAVLTGGASRRMGGRPKGLLLGPDGAPLALRAARQIEALGLPCVLVGHPEIYRPLGLPVIADTRPGEGPLAGLEAALLEATRRGLEAALLVACDMPFFTPALLRRALGAGPGLAAAPQIDGRFEPLMARYDTALLPEVSARLDRGERGMQALLRERGVSVAVDEQELCLLGDWDTPPPGSPRFWGE